MNNAFEGKRESWRDLYDSSAVDASKAKEDKNKKKRMEAILAEAGGMSKDLDPILEENTTGQEVALYKPNMTLAEQRKLKNEELKKKVRMLTGGSKQKDDISDVSSQISSSSSKDFFITGAKTSKKGKAQFKGGDPDSPTARAAKALAIMSGEADDTIPQDDGHSDSRSVMSYKTPGEQVQAELDQTEADMNKMFLELNDLEDMIKGNKDLKTMKELMGVTNDVMNAHMTQCESLKTNIMGINEEAQKAISKLDFYKGEDSGSQSTMNDHMKELVRIEEEHGEEAEDDEAVGIKSGNKVSHEGQKKQIFNQLDDMAVTMRNFTTDIESRLDRIYKQGAGKKFGYEDIKEGSQKLVSGGPKPTDKEK